MGKIGVPCLLLAAPNRIPDGPHKTAPWRFSQAPPSLPAPGSLQVPEESCHQGGPPSLHVERQMIQPLLPAPCISLVGYFANRAINSPSK